MRFIMMYMLVGMIFILMNAGDMASVEGLR